MNIKETVKEICDSKSSERINFLIDFLESNHIPHKLYRYTNGINLEVVREGVQPDKEVIFFSHYDIHPKTVEGANDNTSSVAVMLFIAKFLISYQPAYTIKIVFNDNEEILGGIFMKQFSLSQVNTIIQNVGSYQYLKNVSPQNIVACFILELSGIGDSIFIAESSGAIQCDKKLNRYLMEIADSLPVQYLHIPISATDMISLHLLGISGAVLGAIPYISGKNYLSDVEKKGFSDKIYPHVWKKNHTTFDKYFSIQDKALKMVYDFIVDIIKNIERIDELS